MKTLAIIASMWFLSPRETGDLLEIAPEHIPASVLELVKKEERGELLQAWLYSENGRGCYIFQLSRGGKIKSIYVEPNAKFIAGKREAITMAELPGVLSNHFMVALILGVIPGVIARWLFQTSWNANATVLLKWLTAWIGASAFIIILMSQVTTVPREKDPVVLILKSTVCAAVAASIIEFVGLAYQRLRGNRSIRGWWIISCLLLAVGFLLLSILVEMLHIDRENHYCLMFAMRPLGPALN